MPNKIPIKASTQEHLEIADIRDNLVLLKSGAVSLILQTTAVNFGLLSESEQDATIFAYAGLLNSLSFPVQVVIRSKRSDVSAYIKLLNQQEARQTNPDLKNQIKKYREFVSATVQQNQVLEKSFYFVIPFSVNELGVSGAISTMTNRSKKLPYPKDYIFQQAKTGLYPRRDHLIKQLTRIGINARELTTQELVELFYDIYNPTEVAFEKVAAELKEYTAPMVSPAVETAQQIQPASKLQEPLKPAQKLTTDDNVVQPKASQAAINQPVTSQDLIRQKLQTEQAQKPLDQPSVGQTTKSAQTQQEALRSLQEAMTKAQDAIKIKQEIKIEKPEGEGQKS